MKKTRDLSRLELQDDFDAVDPNDLEIGENLKVDTGLALSISELGILTPPLVSGRKVLDGQQVVAIARKLGKQNIFIRRVSKECSVTAPIHARLVRRPRTVIAVAEDVARWKNQYELEFPGTKKGGNAKAKK